jgi:hypothetical protein
MQELKQVELKQAIGKTIKDVFIEYNSFAIVYTDGSFSCFKEYDDWGIITKDDKKLKYEVFIEKLGIRSDGSTYFTRFQEFLIKAGILDGQKLIEDAKERIEKCAEDCKAKERKEFERLKAKFLNDAIDEIQINSIQYTIDNFFNGKLSGLDATEISEKFNSIKTK